MLRDKKKTNSHEGKTSGQIGMVCTASPMDLDLINLAVNISKAYQQPIR